MPVIVDDLATDPWLTIRQSADYLKVHPATVYRAIESRQLRAARVRSRAYRIRRSWLDAMLTESTMPIEVQR